MSNSINNKPDLYSSHILVVDDDKRIRELLGKYLKDNNYFVSTAKDAEEAAEVLELFEVDLIIMDVMMPGKSGREFTKELRQSSDIPILMLSAMAEIDDKIAGLETGVDDYLVKPFEPKELLLRIYRILSRTKKIIFEKNTIITIGNLNYDLKNNRLTKNDEFIPLTSSEAKLFSILASNIGKTLSREELADLCGGVNLRSVDVQIIRLRNKIEEDPKKPYFLQTIRGEGYLLRSN